MKLKMYKEDMLLPALGGIMCCITWHYHTKSYVWKHILHLHFCQ